jgi:hypothetical protein
MMRPDLNKPGPPGNRMSCQLRLGGIATCLAAGLVLNIASARQQPDPANNPYTVIPARNVFGLSPPPPPLPVADASADLPKISPTGIMLLPDGWRIAFKVAVTGQPVKSYCLTEGRIEDGIEVIAVDPRTGLVTFRNHDVLQELPLVAASSPGATDNASVPFRGAHIRDGFFGRHTD